MQLWKPGFPGIYIDPRRVSDELVPIDDLGPMQRSAFISGTSRNLERIASKPVGRDLLSLISKRCSGIGTKVRNGTCQIFFGPGTFGDTASIDQAIDETFATIAPARRSVSRTMTLIGRTFRTTRTVGGRDMAFAGRGMSAAVSYNPFVNLDAEMITIIKVPTPAFVALAHELVHAFHTLSGDKKHHANPDVQYMIEEARTVGAGKYAATRISENAVRKEHGIPLRPFYVAAGDCDAGRLA